MRSKRRGANGRLQRWWGRQNRGEVCHLRRCEGGVKDVVRAAACVVHFEGVAMKRRVLCAKS